jgi:hypothetical protein
MSRSALARAANIHVVMPRRYEEPDCGEFARPRADSTWIALNKALGYDVPDDIDGLLRLEESVNTPIPEDDSSAPSDSQKPLTLAEAKAGLALTFGVDVNSIEITIRG